MPIEGSKSKTDTKAEDLFSRMRWLSPAQQREFMAKLTDDQARDLVAYLYDGGNSDPRVAGARDVATQFAKGKGWDVGEIRQSKAPKAGKGKSGGSRKSGGGGKSGGGKSGGGSKGKSSGGGGSKKKSSSSGGSSGSGGSSAKKKTSSSSGSSSNSGKTSTAKPAPETRTPPPRSTTPGPAPSPGRGDRAAPQPVRR